MSPNNVPISLKGIRLRTKLHELHLDNNKICFLLADANLTEKTKKKDSPPLNHTFQSSITLHKNNILLSRHNNTWIS